jgi:hypothetical protein
MKVNKELLNAIAYLSKEKGVSADVICDSLEAVLITAYKKEPDANPNAIVELNRQTGDYKILAPKTVVETVEDEDSEISLAMAQILNPEYSEGDVINVNVTPKNFGRVAAQAAKQVMISGCAKPNGASSMMNFPTARMISLRGSSSASNSGMSMSIWEKQKRSCLFRNRFRRKRIPLASASSVMS